jgi:hypothetical protein
VSRFQYIKENSGDGYSRYQEQLYNEDEDEDRIVNRFKAMCVCIEYTVRPKENIIRDTILDQVSVN